MKVTEVKLSRLFNIGNKESHTIGVTISVEEDIDSAFQKAHELIWKMNAEMQDYSAYKFNEAYFKSIITKIRSLLSNNDVRMAEYWFNVLKNLAESDSRLVVPTDIINAFKNH